MNELAHDSPNQTNQVDTYLDSRLDSADIAERLAVEVATRIGFQEEELHKLGMAVRESVVNAVVHGNRYNAKKRVHLLVSNSSDCITVTITDEGQGFDLSSLRNPLAEENLLEQSGRGIFLIRAFVDESHIRRLVPNGTEVKLVKWKHRVV
jgi:serine/threonine-protein kinase RsbW